MSIKHTIAAIAACTMLSGAALAFEGPKNKDKHGAHAQGMTQSEAQQNRRDRRANANSAATSTTGAAVTTRRGGAAAIDTRGTASGRGSVSSSSEGEVYSSTTRDGSDADAYGRSDAEANEPRRRPNN